MIRRLKAQSFRAGFEMSTPNIGFDFSFKIIALISFRRSRGVRYRPTTSQAPMTVSSVRSIPGKINARAPMKTSFPIVIGAVFSGLLGLLSEWLPVQR